MARKSTNNSNERRRTNESADWSRADASTLAAVVNVITKFGGAVRFGYSRDGGAFSIGVYGDGDPYTEYLGSTEDVDRWLQGFYEDYA